MRLGRPTISLSSGTGHGDFEDLDSERLGTCRSWVRVTTLRCAEPCIERGLYRIVSERAPMQLSPERWKQAVSLGLQLADENKRVSHRLASLRKAKAKMKTREVSDDENDQANQE